MVFCYKIVSELRGRFQEDVEEDEHNGKHMVFFIEDCIRAERDHPWCHANTNDAVC